MAGTASFFQTWPDEGRRLRHLRGPASPLPRSARARPRPPEAPGHPRGLLAPLPRQKAHSSPYSSCPRSGRRQPQGQATGDPFPPEPFARPARGARSPAWPAAGPAPASRAAPQAGSPLGRASREAANMAPSVTQPPCPSLAVCHTHARCSGKDPGGRGAQSLFSPTPPPSSDGRGGPRAPKS